MSDTMQATESRRGWLPGPEEQEAALAKARNRLAEAQGAYSKIAEIMPGTCPALILADQKVSAARALVNDILALMRKPSKALEFPQ